MFLLWYVKNTMLIKHSRDHGGRVVTHSPPTSEISGSKSGPYVGKLVVAYRWCAVCSTEP